MLILLPFTRRHETGALRLAKVVREGVNAWMTGKSKANNFETTNNVLVDFCVGRFESCLELIVLMNVLIYT